MHNILLLFLVPAAGILTAGLTYRFVKKQPQGDEKMQQIASAIYKGAKSFLNQVYKVLSIFILIVFVFISIFLGIKIAIAFLLGALFSILAGNIGMRAATLSNVRTAEGLKKDLPTGLKIALNGGAIMGLMVSSLGLLGILILYLLFKDPNIIYGFGFGASGVAIFLRVGGGLYTKAADVGADLVGKVELGIPEDDPRNPAVIADNVGDNVGDVAGMGSDLFESYVDAIIATMAVGMGFSYIFGVNTIILPVVLASAGLIASIIGFIITQFIKNQNPSRVLNLSVWIASGLFLLFSFVVISLLMEKSLYLFFANLIGLLAGLVIGLTSEFYTSSNFKPTKKVAESATNGSATTIITGLSVGKRSTFIPGLMIVVAMVFAYKLAGVYGVALSAVGMLSTLAITLATDCYGPIADNAAGIAEMAHLSKEIREKAESLDAVGNTTAAVGKGFAIGSAALTALALIVGYLQAAQLTTLDLGNVKVLGGVFIGALLPYLISALIMESVGKSASKVVEEVRRQFNEIEGLKDGKADPDYAKCVAVVTKGALKEMFIPGFVTIASPILVGLLLGKESLGGLLVGALVTGFLLAIMMANSGATWDNAKKYIEAGNFGGKHSEAHKAAVVGDTLGDPFKDTAGPSLNILIKLVSIIAILIAPLL